MKQGCVNPRFERNAVILSVLAACFTVESIAFASGPSIAQISATSGQVQIIRASGTLSAQKGVALTEADEVKTGAGGIVQVKFEDGSSFTLYEKSSLRIDQYKKKQASSRGLAESAFHVLHGKLRFFINPKAKEKARTQFKSKTAVMGIRGTSGIIDVSPAGLTQLVVLSGLVEINNPKFPSMVVSVAPNFTTQVSPERAPQPPQAISPAELQNLVPSVTPGAGFTDDGPVNASPSTPPIEPKRNEKGDGQEQPQKDDKAPKGEPQKGQESEDDKQSTQGRGKKPTGSVKTLFAPGGGVVGKSNDVMGKPGVSVAPSAGSTANPDGTAEPKSNASSATSGGMDGVFQQSQPIDSVEVQRELQRVTTTISTTTEKTVEVVREVIAPTIQPTQPPPNPTQKVKINIGLPRD